MAIKTLIYGADKYSDEYRAAEIMEKIIKRDIPSHVEGEIVLYASATLFGQTVKDVDLIILGKIDGYSIHTTFNGKDKDGKIQSIKMMLT